MPHPALPPAPPPLVRYHSLEARVPEPLPITSVSVLAQALSPQPEAPPQTETPAAPVFLEIPTQNPDPAAPEPVQLEIPPDSPAPTTPAQTQAPAIADVIELRADRQEYDVRRQVFIAEGNVVMRVRGALLSADLIQGNVPDRIAVAAGDVAFTRGEQVLLGDRFEYNYGQGTGTIVNARGDVFIPTAAADLDITLPTDVSAGVVPAQTLSDRLIRNQPPQQVTSPGGITATVGAGRDAPAPQFGGTVRRLRFTAERIELSPEGWQARNIRITNDPFSPPELELRADSATLTQVSPTETVLEAAEPRLVFDQGLSLPLLVSRTELGPARRNPPGLPQFGFDQGDRGGLFFEGTFDVINTERLRFSVTPQIFAQRIVEQSGNIFDPNSYGLNAELNANLGPRTSVRGSLTFPGINFTQIEQRLRANLRARQLIGDHTLGLEYSYRDRLFNGSLGFQDVQSSLGAVLTSPTISFGNGFALSYQAGAQWIRADTDRPALLAADRTNNRVDLGRLQASAALSWGFFLWQGEPLEATATEGLRYTPSPVVPYVQLVTGVTGVTSAYSNGDTQEALTGTIGVQAQFGHFSRSFLDYTGFNIGYSQTSRSGLSPFLFDRVVDTKVLSGGVVQQLYGPLRIGVQTSINLDTNRAISTDYILEYSRRTYGLTLRYNPILQVGAVGLRISDFNWLGGTEPFSGTQIRPVEGGVRRSTD